jgi:diacylglycerol kinase (ATP)
MRSRKFSIPARLRSFRHAFKGWWWMIREEHNSWIHLAIVLVLIPVCFIVRLNLIEWVIIILCIGMVLGMELMNSAIERIADKISPEHDPEIGKIKDLAAGAVLVCAIAAAIVGLIIIIPKFLLLIQA